ncbi:MAG: GNAT family N-acetyltransferase [Sedimentisphaerales bacterium]|nr:GNAT family N-acetyltransferase [Sedimentisphaerales bacterium]
MVQIRAGTEVDIDDLLVIEDECFSVYYYGQDKFGVEEFLYYLYGPHCVLLVAAWDERVVGYTACVVRPRAGSLAHVDSIGVLPKHQNQGIGHRLLQELIQKARQQRCKGLALEVAVPNEAGIAFFKSHGFREVRKLPGYYGRNLDGLLMTAEIWAPYF